jgi:hypothetical protein
VGVAVVAVKSLKQPLLWVERILLIEPKWVWVWMIPVVVVVVASDVLMVHKLVVVVEGAI